MAREWPETPDDTVDPALAPLIEAGEGESEGFELAEADLIEHAEHGDQPGTEPIMRDGAQFDDLLSRGETLGAVAPRRYFCTQCHVPQADAPALIKNTFTDMSEIGATGAGSE